MGRWDESGSSLLPIAMATVASGCGSTATHADIGSGAYGIVRGAVTAGPTCPVEQAGHPCPPRPVSGAVSARRTDGTTRTATISKDGTYRVKVPAGTYALNVQTESRLPRCPPVKVVVSAGAAVQAKMFCDTVIR
jgi:hypothetical protein